MRLVKPLLIAIVVVGSVGLGVAVAKADASINGYVDGLGVPPALLAKPTDWRRSGDNWVVDREQICEFNQFFTFDPNVGVLWPGSVLQGKSLRAAGYAIVSVDRGPLTLAITGLKGKDGRALSASVERPTAATVDAALADLLRKADPTSCKAVVKVSEETFSSLEQLLTKLKIDTSYLGSVAELHGKLDTEHYQRQTNVAFDFQEAFYDVSVVPPASPSAWFAESVKADDLARFAGKENPPVAVSDVQYGRRVVLLFTAKTSTDKLKAAVNAAVNFGMFDGTTDFSAEQLSVLKESEMRGFVVGGNAVDAVKLAAGAENIKQRVREYFKGNKAPWSVESPGVPIGYRLNYLKDNSAAAIQFKLNQTLVRPAAAQKYMLRWCNHFQPKAIYRVTRPMERGKYGGDENRNYLPYVERIPAIPGKVLWEKEVGGDEHFKSGPDNFWCTPEYGNLPSLIQDGMHVMDDERWFLVCYREDVPKPND